MSEQLKGVESDSSNQLLANNLECFIENIESLNSTFPMFMMVLSEVNNHATKEHVEFLEKNGTLIEESEGRKRYDLDRKHLHKAKKLGRHKERIKKSENLIPRNLVVSLISEYDAFLGGLLKSFYITKPILLNNVDRHMTYSDLISFASVEDAKDHILEKEVESVLRKSHIEHFNILEKKFSIDLRKGLNIWSEFVELTERRNLFVHCDGLVSSQYIKSCKENNALAEGICLGDKLSVNPKYVKSTFDILNEIAIKLTHVLWRKVLPNEREAADKALVNLSFELLQEERYQLVSNILDLFVNTIKNFHNDIYKRMFVINLAISYKLSNQKEKCQNELEKLDWGASSYNFKIANAVLNDDFKKAAELMGKVVATDELGEAELLEWPLFKEFRESEDFIAAFTSCFGKEPFELESVDINTENIDSAFPSLCDEDDK